jgi:hypothetical protein
MPGKKLEALATAPDGARGLREAIRSSTRIWRPSGSTNNKPL